MEKSQWINLEDIRVNETGPQETEEERMKNRRACLKSAGGQTFLEMKADYLKTGLKREKKGKKSLHLNGVRMQKLGC